MADTAELEGLLIRLNEGQGIAEPELEQLVQVLDGFSCSDPEGPISLDEIYSLLLVLGKTKNHKFIQLVERFLSIEDPTTVGLALDILCNTWGLAENYFERLLSLSLGAAWDPENDVRTAAIEILGQLVLNPHSEESYIRTHALKVLSDALSDDDLQIRATAYRALLKFVGKSELEIPSIWQLLADDWEVDASVLVLTNSLNG